MWTWNQANGNLSRNGELVGTGYAGGNKGKHPEAVNNPGFEYLRDVGPLPKGTYTIGDFIDHPHLGKFAAHLTPSSQNVMYGRSGFFIHGDTEEMNQSASDGCPVLPRSVREAIAQSNDKEFQVV